MTAPYDGDPFQPLGGHPGSDAFRASPESSPLLTAVLPDTPPPDYRPPTNGLAISALVTGMAGLGVVPLVFGILGLQRSRRIYGVGKGMSIAGIVLGGVGILGHIIAFVLALVLLATVPALTNFPDRDLAVAVDQLATQPRLGQCLDYSERYEAFLRAPCDGQHDAEIVGYQRFTHDMGGYPGMESLMETAAALCQSAFAEYVGVPVDESEFYYHALIPTQIEWGLGYRRIVCIAATDGEGPMPVGSVRGLAR